MGDFGLDTDVHGDDGRYRARLSPDWEIWGPCGGYVAAVALRAAGAHSDFDLPASVHCHLLGVAQFDDVDLETTTLRRGRRGESVRVSMRQGDRPVCEMLVWLAAEGDGLSHDWTQPPALPPPPQVPTIEEQVSDWAPWYPFWTNFEYRPFDWVPQEQRPAVAPLAPRYDAWFRYLPVARFDDPLVEAGRVLLLADIAGWPAAAQAIPPGEEGRFIAPNLDLAVIFHQPLDAGEYLLLRAEAPVAAGGFIGATGTVWSEDGHLLASTIQQMMCRPAPPLPG